MRANEFLTELATNSHYTKIVKHLKKNGYKKLGAGVGAMVYSKDVGSVIKIIFAADPELSVRETEIFKTFYDVCCLSKSPHLPKFVSIGGKHYETFVLDGEEFTMIAMEKLQKLVVNSIEEAIVWASSDFITKRLSWEDARNQLTDVITWKYFDGRDSVELAEFIKSNIEAIELKWKPFYSLCQVLFTIGEKKGYYWDLHTENVMRRGSTPVIIDPWTA